MTVYSVNKNDDPNAIAGEAEIVFSLNKGDQSGVIVRVKLTSGTSPLACLMLAFDKQGIVFTKRNPPAHMFTDDLDNYYFWGIIEKK
jgi:hypothetical protein